MNLRFMSALLLCVFLMTIAGGAAVQPVFSQARQVNSGIGYANARVGRTRILYPRLTRFRDAKVMREVNRQIDEATKDFNCDRGSGRESYFRVRSKVAYADRDIFSIYASAQYYCGGPYPTNDS